MLDLVANGMQLATRLSVFSFSCLAGFAGFADYIEVKEGARGWSAAERRGKELWQYEDSEAKALVGFCLGNVARDPG